jgi:hypothetical protein
VEIRAVSDARKGIEAKLDRMAERGELLRPSSPRRPFRKIARRPGALERFLADRGE